MIREGRATYGRLPVATCVHCRRPITRPDGWLHTDGRERCLDVWRWDVLNTVAEPAPKPEPLPEPTYQPGPNVNGKNGRGAS